MNQIKEVLWEYYSDSLRIDQDGKIHTFNIGHTAYCKDHAPGCGHKPQIIIENDDSRESD
jgi:hypothetical protein